MKPDKPQSVPGLSSPRPPVTSYGQRSGDENARLDPVARASQLAEGLKNTGITYAALLEERRWYRWQRGADGGTFSHQPEVCHYE